MNPRVLDSSKLEEIVKKKGWTNLTWFSGDNKLNPVMSEVNGKIIVERARYRLHGCPPGHKNDERYRTIIAIGIYSSSDKSKTIGYKWVLTKKRKYVREEQ